ncbi:MAG TPA: hypothetical protein VGS79_24830 [Puia sp.]|nr:hypothetical protein [Puia sp.]
MRSLDAYEAIVRDAALFDERNFEGRLEAIELLELAVLQATAEVAGPGSPAAGADWGRDSQAAAANRGLTRGRVERLIAALEAVDERFFARLRAEIAAGRHRGRDFEELLLQHCVVEDGPGYDMLDVFVNRLCSFLPMPVPTRVLEAEMVDFHKTPARVVLQLARRVVAEDVFVDLGAGLGQVAMLVHLLTGARTRGVEIEPVFCGYARQCAAELRLADVAFCEGDARFADYSQGTVFFMYTPFRGELLETVFGLLRREALSRSFMLVTFGPCSAYAARQDWLRVEEYPGRGDGLCFFRAG